MADDELNEDELPDDEVPDLDDELDEGEAFVEPDEDAEVADTATPSDDDDEDDDEAAEPAPQGKKRPKADAEDDEDDDLDPDDVEADLDAILKDRIAAADEEDDDEEDVAAPPPRATADTPDGVVPKRANEFTCTGCFLLVNRAQFGQPGSLECPVGESDCPAVAILEEGPASR